MKQNILTIFILTIIFATLFYFGGTILLIGLGVIALTTALFMAFTLGSRWTFKVMQAGADLAIRSAASNDEHDATKIKALSELTREAIKAKNESLKNGNYPALPPFAGFTEGSFTIAGLDSEETDVTTN